MVDLGVARRQREHDRDADAGTDVAHEAVDAGGFGARAHRQGGVGHGRDRHEHQSQSQALDHAGIDHRPYRHVGIPAGDHPHRQRGQADADRGGDARVDAARQDAPTSTIATRVPMPRGASSMPVVITG